MKFSLIFLQERNIFCDFIALDCRIFYFCRKTNFKTMTKNKLQEKRISKKLSQEYMANSLGMDVSNYSRRENGQTKISKNEWMKMAKLLDVPLEDIFEDEEGIVFIFNDQATGNGNIVTNYSIPQYIMEHQKKYIEKLENEITALQAQINKG